MITFRECFEGTAGVLVSHDNVGIPRSEMPQLPKTSISNFLDFLSGHGVTYRDDLGYPLALVRLTQSDIYLDKVRDLIPKLYGEEATDFDSPFILDCNGHLLDGHHRFLAIMYGGLSPKVHAIITSVDIKRLVLLALRFLEES